MENECFYYDQDTDEWCEDYASYKVRSKDEEAWHVWVCDKHVIQSNNMLKDDVEFILVGPPGTIGANKCGCLCHSMAGVSHIKSCCGAKTYSEKKKH